MKDSTSVGAALERVGVCAQPTILVIDDEPNIVRFLERALRGHGYLVDGALDGGRGLALTATGRYRLVILDLALPDVSGIAALRAIKARVPGQPVLVLSARSDVEAKVRCLELGANDYVTKPFALAKLIARIRACLRDSTEPPAGRFLRVGEVTLDLQRHVAECNSRSVSLSVREFDLLVYLMRRAGTVCSRSNSSPIMGLPVRSRNQRGRCLCQAHPAQAGKRHRGDLAQCGIYLPRGVTTGWRSLGRPSPSSTSR